MSADGKELPFGGKELTAAGGKELSSAQGADLTQVRADEALIALLSARATPAPPTEPVVELLAALAADVDLGLASALSRPLPEVSVSSIRPRRRAVPVLAVAGAVALVVAGGGVAAAATGSPFGPVRAAVAALTGHQDRADHTDAGDPGTEANGSDPGAGSGGGSGGHGPGTPSALPTTASAHAQLNHLLIGVSAAIAHGQFTDAAQRILTARQLAGDLPEPLAGWFGHRLDVLQAQLERALTRAEKDHGHSGDHGRPTDPGSGHGQSGDHGRPTDPGSGHGQSGDHGRPTDPGSGHGQSGDHGRPTHPGAKPDKGHGPTT